MSENAAIDAYDFSHYMDDPYVAPGFERDSVEEDAEVVVIGGGLGGGFGGTWYWKRYPGASCDIESYVYLPMLEETGLVPKQKYTDAPEALDVPGVAVHRPS